MHCLTVCADGSYGIHSYLLFGERSFSCNLGPMHKRTVLSPTQVASVQIPAPRVSWRRT